MPLLGAGYREVVQIMVELKEKISGRTKKVEESLKGLSKANQTLMLASRQLGVDMATVTKGLSIQGLVIDDKGRIINKFTKEVVDQNKAIITAGRVTKRFRMELLSVLFFGMALSRLFGAITKPAYEAVGAFELWNTTLMLTAIGPASKVGEAMDWLAEQIERLPQPMQDVIGWTAVFGQGFGNALMQIGQFTLGIIGMKMAFPATFAAMTKSVVGLNHALLSLAWNPWFWLIGVALFLLYLSFTGHFDGIKDHIQNWLDWFTTNIYGPIRGFFTENIPEALETLRDWFSDIWKSIKNVVSTVWNIIKDTIKNALDAIRQWFSDRLENIKNILSSAWNWIRDNVIDSIISFFTVTIPNSLRILKDWFSDRWEGIKTIVSGVYNWLKEHVWNPIINFFTVSIPNAADTLKDRVVGAWQWIHDRVKGIKDAIVGFFQNVIDKIKDVWNTASEFGTKIRDKIIEMVPAPLRSIAERIGGLFGGVLGDFVISGGRLYKTNPLDTIVGSKNFGNMGNTVTIQNPVIHISSVVGRDSTDMIVREVIEKLGMGLMRAI